MTLLWLAPVALVALVPVLVVALNRVEAALDAISTTAGELAGAGAKLVADLDAVGALAETSQLATHARAGLLRYGAALDKML